LSIRGEFNAADQVRRGLERTWTSAEKVSLSASCIAARCSAGRSNALRTSAGSDAVLRASASTAFASSSISRKRRDEHLAHALFQTRPGEIRQRLARDGKHLLLGPAADGLIKLIGVVSQRLLPLGTQGVGGLPRFVEEPLTFGLRLVRRFAQERGALLVELLVLVLELVALLLGLGFFASASASSAAIRALARVDGVEDGLDRESASATTPG
jgi:hypothetical protein